MDQARGGLWAQIVLAPRRSPMRSSPLRFHTSGANMRQSNARRAALLGLSIAVAACSGKKRYFGEADLEALEGADGGNASPLPTGAMTPGPSKPESIEDDAIAATLDQGSGVCETDGSCRCDEASESCSPTALCTNGASVCDATCPGCFINGVCVEALARHPLDQCLMCDPSRDTQGWSSIEAAACDDGLFCTTDDRCIEGECTGTARVCEDGVACNGSSTCDEAAARCSPAANQCPAGAICDVASDTCVDTCAGCLLDGVCLDAGAEEPGNPCRICDPSRSATAYTVATGKSCGSSEAPCSEQDTCDERGICQPNHAAEGSPCGDATSSACNQADECDGSGTCRSRVVSNGTPCDDGSFCAVGDQCQGGVCISAGNRNCGAGLACDEQRDQCRCQGCVIGNRCLAGGAVNAANPCQVCDPARSTTSFSPNVNAACGSGATECSGQDTCNGQGQCAPNHFPVGTSCDSVSEGQCQADGTCRDLLAGRAPILLATIEEEGRGIVIDGAQASDQVGTAVAGGGDVNGDGIDDLVIGTNGAERNGVVRGGLAFVVFGTRQRTSISLAAVENGQGGFVVTGASENEFLGNSVAMAGDVNGDGLDDVIVGASGVPLGENLGAAYVVFGKGSTAPISVAGVASGQGGGFAINSVTGDSRLGNHVAAAGDVNGDGLADIIVSVAGIRAGARVVFGKSGTSAVDSEALQSGGFAILSGSEAISSVAGVGDVNGDGLDDVGLGAPDAAVSGNADAGRAYVVFGKTLRTPVELSALQDGQPGGFVMNGARAGDGAGASISGAGDLNRDGLSDIVVGANRAESNGNAAVGRAYVVFGRASSTPQPFTVIEAGAGNGFAMNGVGNEDATGVSVTGVGDVNGDGVDDVLIGAPIALAFSGVSYLVYGKSSNGPVALAALRSGGRGGFSIQGANAFEVSGSAVGSVDFDGDGMTDLLIGAPLASPGGIGRAGMAYVVFGQPTL